MSLEGSLHRKGGSGGEDWRRTLLPMLPTTNPGLQEVAEMRPTDLVRPRISVDRVVIAQPLGFCAGVDRAISALSEFVQMHPGQTVYSYHGIVHNKRVIDYFEGEGVVFVDDIKDVPQGAPLMLSAHGSSPDVIKQAQDKRGPLVDAACPLVTKVHDEIGRAHRKGATLSI
jgi:4-hydroxy-3-methylbut-2-enyl diphosphate reductase IspH